MFADKVEVKLGEETVVVTRLPVKRLREEINRFALGGDQLDEHAENLIREMVRTKDGKEIDPGELSMPQQRQLVSALIGFPEGSGISDFIGLLC